MNPLRQCLLRAYQLATSRRRRQLVERLAAQGRAPVCVLFYHRVGANPPSEWSIAPAGFQRHLDWLARRFEFVSLREAQRRIAEQDSRSPAVSITFDDGYADNLTHAAPMLLERGVPFTYFVCSKIVREGGVFPHDADAGLPLRSNTIDELRRLADAGVEIGAHSRTHADLGSSTAPEFLRDEVAGSIEDLGSWLGRRIRYFAFPYGQPHTMTPEAVAVARAAGIEGVCSAYNAYNFPGPEAARHGAYHIRRIHGDAEWVRFLNWMTIDPRRVPQEDPIDDDQFLRLAERPDVAVPAGLAPQSRESSD